MKVQLASDIHLEKNPSLTFRDVIHPQGDVLILAGDIGNPTDPTYYAFLKECSDAFAHTILIAGNHEYRRAAPLTMHEVDLLLNSMCKTFSNVYYLQHGSNKCIENIQFIGATMWTPIRKGMFKPEQETNLNATFSTQRMNKHTPWSIQQNNRTHVAHLTEIEKRINWGLQRGMKNVVVTHHAPLLNGPFAKQDLPTDFLYGTDLSVSLAAPAITAWVFGHTHHNYQSVHNGTIVASNQYGGRGVHGWTPTFTIDI